MAVPPPDTPPPGALAAGRAADADRSDPPPDTRCGFVAVVGAPNVGKSTLVNGIVGSKVSIVSPKAQTTRFRVIGIVNRDRTQLLLVDTPGLFQPRKQFDRALVSAAWRGMADADVRLMLVDSRRGIDPACEEVVGWLKAQSRQAILVLNKIDLVAKPALLRLVGDLTSADVFSDTFMISARTGDGVDDLVRHIAGRLPAGPWLYPADDLSDLPNAMLAAEITREQVFWQLQDEIPYAIAVETESWREQDNGSVRIEQTIFVERPTQRAIVLGRSGEQIRRIGERARLELERLLDRRVHLFLHVRVWKTWRQDRAFLTRQHMDAE